MQKSLKFSNKTKDAIIICVFVFLCATIFSLDIFHVSPAQKGEKVKAEVVEVDNSSLMIVELVAQGEQRLKVKILQGKFDGKIFDAVNLQRSQMELDKIFKVGDTAIVSIPEDADENTTINAQDHYRIGWTITLFALFSILLVAFGGMVGAKSLISFVFSCAIIWKIVVPLCLLGYNAILICFIAVMVLSATIIFLVASFTQKGFSAFCGTILGVGASCAMGWLFTYLFKINGAVMPYSQALLYAGYPNLSISDLYIGAIFLSSSGAVMDLAMDVSAGMEELKLRNPQITSRQLLESGWRIGRSVVGTMSTTLLLAYTGGYLTLMMTFLANGIEPIDFINNPHVASELVKTLVGSFGLVLVAPFTAIAGSIIFSSKKALTNNIKNRLLKG